jgi:pyruvate,water dikinase
MRGVIVPLASPEAVDPERFGPKAANLARLGQAGLPTPGGFCVDARAYRMQVAALGLEEAARAVSSADRVTARRAALAMKLGLMDRPIVPQVLDPLLDAWRALTKASGALTVVRSSALVEDRFGSSFAGQFESYLGLEGEAELVTAVRSCWAALWSTRVLRYMATHDANPADTAMAVLVQPLVAARVSGGGLSRSPQRRHPLERDDGGGEMVINAAPGLGSAIAQGEVVPDRIVLDREARLIGTAPGRKLQPVSCAHTARAARRIFAARPCLEDAHAIELGRMLRTIEDLLGMPVEIEWALDGAGVKLLQARPLHLEPAEAPDEIWKKHPGLSGHPAGVGWGSGRACVVNCECELSRVVAGDILVTRVAGPALSSVLPRVAGVVAELGGSTSHIASLARERGIPMVLGVLEATERIPDGARVAVDGVAGVVRWMR